jgi:hypothetical protein
MALVVARGNFFTARFVKPDLVGVVGLGFHHHHRFSAARLADAVLGSNHLAGAPPPLCLSAALEDLLLRAKDLFVEAIVEIALYSEPAQQTARRTTKVA